jgi:hypothetical protein
MIMAAQQDKIQQNVERRKMEVKENDIRSLTQPAHGEPLHFLRATFTTNHGPNWYWYGPSDFIKPHSYVFASLTEIDPNTYEPKAHGTVKYHVSSVSPRDGYVDLKFEAWNGAQGIMTRADMLFYTFTYT